MADIDTDLILMTLLIFVPSVFAVVLLFFPKGSEDYMRWWSLLGTAIAFVLSAMLFINYFYMLDFNRDSELDKKGVFRPKASTSLADRASVATKDRAGNQPAKNNDLIGRVPWISRFNIDYFLGVDGISMALVLLTTVVTFLSMIASWKIDKHVKGYCALFLLLET